MTTPRSKLHSAYIEWAKTRSHARYNLATSGIQDYPLAKLPARLEDIELSGPSGYGYAPLQERLARKCGVPESCVVHAVGTSMANHLAMAATFEPGDGVLIEQPAYEPLLNAAEFLGARIRRFPRPFEDGFRLDPRAVERAMTPRTRLIVVTHPHNPTGVRAEPQALAEIGGIARRAGARVLVDEVYLEASPEPVARWAFHGGEQFLTTTSLTKAFGLSGLRCGWILAVPELAEQMWRLNDLYGVIPAHPAERLSVVALDHLDQIAADARALLAQNRARLDRFLDSRKDLSAVRPPAGTIVFPRLLRGSVDRLCALLREKYETSVVPGKFFEMPDHFRIGIGGEPAMVAEGLERLAAALDELGRAS